MRVHDSVELRELPTWQLPAPSPYPMYFDSRVYQGSSGQVYPLPYHEQLGDAARPTPWTVVTLENELVQLEIMPELGGRILRGYDKLAGYDFFYRQDSIKPALVGLAGPWMSGGVEFNWPQHHRPATWMPTAHHLEREADGAVTVWLGDHDPMQRMRASLGLRLRPGSALIEARVRLCNRTPLTRSFLWWANVAAEVHDDYQSFFPPDVDHVADHAARAMSGFPVAGGVYYGVDYAPGTDLSWYRNIPVPTSYMVRETAFDFFGGYDHRAGAGFVHVADRHIAPGKKQWTWGNHAFGHAWDRELDERARPYVELMAGVYTDNQPDFTYLLPYEVKTFSQFWWPFQSIGPLTQADRRAALSLRREGEHVLAGAAAAETLTGWTVRLRSDAAVLCEQRVDLRPGTPWQWQGAWPAETGGLRLELADTLGSVQLCSRYHAPQRRVVLPPAATEPPAPADCATQEERVLVGEHLELYRHPTRDPEAWWRTALEEDPDDSRATTWLGRRALDEGRLEEAAEHLRRAICRLTARHPNPVDGEAHYLLGLCRERQGALDAAIDCYRKAAWNYAWRTPGLYRSALLCCRRGHRDEALARCREAQRSNADCGQALALEARLLRHAGDAAAAATIAARAVALDPMDHLARAEAWFAGDAAAGTELQRMIGNDAALVTDLVVDAMEAGHLDEAGRLVELAPVSELSCHLRALLADRRGDRCTAAAWRERASAAAVDELFPHTWAHECMLRATLAAEPKAARPAALLGTRCYAIPARRDEAIDWWQQAIANGDVAAVTARNLGLALVNHRQDAAAGLAAYRRALDLAPGDARLVYEYDQLRARMGASPAERLDDLDPALVAQRDDLSVVWARLCLLTGCIDAAHDLLMQRRFHPWEGGEGQVLRVFTDTQLARARAARRSGDLDAAQAAAELALHPPAHLGEARHLLAADPDIHAELASIASARGDSAATGTHWQRAAETAGDFLDMAVTAFSPATWYRGCALQALGRHDQARELFHQLAAWASEQATLPPSIDYFATSLPDFLVFSEDLERRRDRDMALLQAIAARGLGDTERARAGFAAVLAMDPAHYIARSHAQEMDEELPA